LQAHPHCSILQARPRSTVAFPGLARAGAPWRGAGPVVAMGRAGPRFNRVPVRLEHAVGAQLHRWARGGVVWLMGVDGGRRRRRASLVARQARTPQRWRVGATLWRCWRRRSRLVRWQGLAAAAAAGGAAAAARSSGSRRGLWALAGAVGQRAALCLAAAAPSVGFPGGVLCPRTACMIARRMCNLHQSTIYTSLLYLGGSSTQRGKKGG
jgi:hypothetical protein